MIESAGTQLPPAPASQKTQPWIIVVVVLVLLCCGCFGAIGLLIAFVPDILHELGLTSWLPLLAVLA
jgi:hypothetical protein